MAGTLGAFLVAAGAVLYWVVDGGDRGGSMDLIGVALMMVGVAGLIRSLLPPPAGPGRRDDDRSDRRALQAWKR